MGIALFGHNNKFRISTQLEFFPEIVDWLHFKKPDFWKISTPYKIGRANKFPVLSTISALALIAFGFIVEEFFQLTSLFGILLLLNSIPSWLKKPHTLKLEKDKLIIIGNLKTQKILISDIIDIHLYQEHADNSNYQTIYLLIDNDEKPIEINSHHFGKKTVTLYNILKTWFWAWQPKPKSFSQ